MKHPDYYDRELAKESVRVLNDELKILLEGPSSGNKLVDRLRWSLYTARCYSAGFLHGKGKGGSGLSRSGLVDSIFLNGIAGDLEAAIAALSTQRHTAGLEVEE